MSVNLRVADWSGNFADTPVHSAQKVKAVQRDGYDTFV